MAKLSKTQKREIKAKSLKALNIACYIITALSILIFTIVGVKSCSDKKKDLSSNVVSTTPVNTLVDHKRLNGNTTRIVNGSTYTHHAYEYSRYFGGYTYVMSNFYYDAEHIRTNYPAGTYLFNGDVRLGTFSKSSTANDVATVNVGIVSLQITDYVLIDDTHSIYQDYDTPGYIPIYRIGYKTNPDSNVSYNNYSMGQAINGSTLPFFKNTFISFFQLTGYDLYSDTSNVDVIGGSFYALQVALNELGFIQRDSLWTTYTYQEQNQPNISTSVSLRSNYYFDYTFSVGNYFPNGNIDTWRLETEDVIYYNGFNELVLFAGSFTCNRVNYSYITLSYYKDDLNVLGNVYKYVLIPYELRYKTSLNDSGLLVARNKTLQDAFDRFPDGLGDTLFIDANRYGFNEYSFTWLNTGYKTIYIDSYVVMKCNATLMNFNYTPFIDVLGYLTVDGHHVDGDSSSVTTGVFALLGSVFSSLGGFFSYEVLPGITLGTLIFIPLVVSLVIFVVWLFKR